jgi:hypothetical protein
MSRSRSDDWPATVRGVEDPVDGLVDGDGFGSRGEDTLLVMHHRATARQHLRHRRRTGINAAGVGVVFRVVGSAGFPAAGDDENDPSDDSETGEDGWHRNGMLLLGGHFHRAHFGDFLAAGEGKASNRQRNDAGEDEQCSQNSPRPHSP